MDNELRFNLPINNVVKKAHQRACLISRCFKSGKPALLFRAFCVYVRPILEYCVQVWSPSYICDINKIEQVQRRFMKRLAGYRSLTYCERLEKLHADTLKLRRLKLCLTMIYKILHGLIDTDVNLMFTPSTTCTRGHRFKLVKAVAQINCYRNSFACRNTDAWNYLPSEVVASLNVLAFKKLLYSTKLDNFLRV
jgi:hypothetical protein